MIRESRRRNCEIGRLSQGCVGVRRSTGQHPGGIIVLPLGEEIHSFTPVQHPANDMKTDIITTHFDYHSIDHNLLKLDILGHDDPTMIRMLEDLTGLDAKTIPLDDKEVMSLFQDTHALGITPDQIGGCPSGGSGYSGVRYGLCHADACGHKTCRAFRIWSGSPVCPMVLTYGWEMPRH